MKLDLFGDGTEQQSQAAGQSLRNPEPAVESPAMPGSLTRWHFDLYM